MELAILQTALKSRNDYEILAQYLVTKRWSREFQILFGFIEDYYKRDRDAKSVDPEVLVNIIEGAVRNDKHTEKFVGILKEALGQEASGANIKEAVLLAKREEVSQTLAMAIANGKKHDDILEEYNALLAVDDLEEQIESGIEIYTAEDMERLLLEEIDPTTRLAVYPRVLGERLGGGMRGSDKMTIMGRPEIAKTGLILTIGCGFAREGHPGIIFNNEERIARLYIRAISNLTGLTGQEVKRDINHAMGLAMERGFGNLTFVSMSPGSPHQIEKEIERREGTQWFIVDQLRNLLVKSDNKVNQLEDAAKAIRNIGKKHNLATIDVTQAGDSAQNKSVLDMGDVDNSNTGIPGACDVLLGIGANEQQKEQGIRVLAPIKNKLSDREDSHEAFPTRVNTFISKYISL